jgi:hypothetical protein
MVWIYDVSETLHLHHQGPMSSKRWKFVLYDMVCRPRRLHCLCTNNWGWGLVFLWWYFQNGQCNICRQVYNWYSIFSLRSVFNALHSVGVVKITNLSEKQPTTFSTVVSQERGRKFFENGTSVTITIWRRCDNQGLLQRFQFPTYSVTGSKLRIFRAVAILLFTMLKTMTLHMLHILKVLLHFSYSRRQKILAYQCSPENYKHGDDIRYIIFHFS